MVTCAYHPTYTESINRSIAIQASPSINIKSYSKNS
jgi:hypothetical protein